MKKRRSLISILLLSLLSTAVYSAPMTKEEFLSKFPRPKILPKVELSLSDNDQSRIVRGKSADFRATISHPAAGMPFEAIDLVVPEGDWRYLVYLEVRDQKGIRQKWNLKMKETGPPTRSSKITPSEPQVIEYVLDTETSSKLTSGNYSAVAVLLAGVYGKRVRSKTFSFKVEEEMAAKESSLVPKISAFVNGSKEVGVFRGWPIIVKVTVDHPQTPKEGEKLEPIILVSEKDWTDLLSVEVTDAENKPVEWSFSKSLLAKTGPKTALDGTNGAFMAYLLSPKATKKIEPGEYTLSVVLKGQTPSKSSALKVKMINHPETLPEKGEVARDSLMAMYHALKGDKEKAVRTAENITHAQIPAPEQLPRTPIGPANIQQQSYEPASSGPAELLNIISAFGFENEIPSVESIPLILSEPDTLGLTVPAAGDAILAGPGGTITDRVVNHAAQPKGFAGPDMTIRVEWSEPVDVDLSMNYAVGGGIPNTTECKQGPCFEEFRPWDLPLHTEEDELLVGAYLHPINGGPNKATVKVSYQRSPNEPWQSETVVLDEEKNQEFWIAYKVDIASGAVTPVKGYYSSADSYIVGDPEVIPPQSDPEEPEEVVSE